MLEVRSMIRLTALRRLASPHTGSTVLNSSSRGHGSAKAYGRVDCHATAFGFFAWMAWKVPREMFIALSSWCWDISSALLVSEPAITKISRFGTGRAWKPAATPHQFGSSSQTNCVGLALVSLYGTVPIGQP